MNGTLMNGSQVNGINFPMMSFYSTFYCSLYICASQYKAVLFCLPVLVPVYPSACDSVPSPCGVGAFCSTIISSTPGQNRYWCPCLPGFYRTKALNECQRKSVSSIPSLCQYINIYLYKNTSK